VQGVPARFGAVPERPGDVTGGGYPGACAAGRRVNWLEVGHTRRYPSVSGHRRMTGLSYPVDGRMGVIERRLTNKRASGGTMKKTHLVIAGLAIAGTMFASAPASAQPTDL
jgi:hypothetical protein